MKLKELMTCLKNPEIGGQKELEVAEKASSLIKWMVSLAEIALLVGIAASIPLP